MIRMGVIGFGKMGMTHYAILNEHPDVEMVAICDNSAFVLAMMKKSSNVKCYSDYKKMINECNLGAVLVTTPTSSHAEIIQYALERNLHVFVEKPFCLNSSDGKNLSRIAKEKKLVNQVGYHCRFCGVFQEAKRVLESGVIGSIYHFSAETYGPVVVKEQSSTWRFKKSEGGGCLYDYASHCVNLVNYLVGHPNDVSGVVLKKIYSKEVEDAVYATILYAHGLSGQLAVNWSDPSHRKMTNQVTIMGTKGKLYVDRQECRVFLHEGNATAEFPAGLTVKYITDLTKPVWFYIRGEEYSYQLDYFVQCIKSGNIDNISSFQSALETDIIIEKLLDKGITQGV